MKNLNRNAIAITVFALVANCGAMASDTEIGYIDFGKFSPPEGGGQFVEVNIKGNLISMAARLAQREEPEIAELLRGLKLVRVNVIGLDQDNRAEIEDRVSGIRARLEKQGWESIVTARNGNDDVRVYLKTRGDEAVEGLVVTVLGKQGEAVLVNIVGDIQPEKVAVVGERFNIEPLKELGLAQPKS